MGKDILLKVSGSDPRDEGKGSQIFDMLEPKRVFIRSVIYDAKLVIMHMTIIPFF